MKPMLLRFHPAVAIFTGFLVVLAAIGLLSQYPLVAGLFGTTADLSLFICLLLAAIYGWLAYRWLDKLDIGHEGRDQQKPPVSQPPSVFPHSKRVDSYPNLENRSQLRA